MQYLFLAGIALAFYGLYLVMRDQQMFPRAHGRCPECGSRYTVYLDYGEKDARGPHWLCRECNHMWEDREGK